MGAMNRVFALKLVTIIAATYARQLVGYINTDNEASRKMVVLDHCGKFLWSLPTYPKQVFVGFDDSLIVITESSKKTNIATVYSRDGKLMAGPVHDVGTFLSLGADNVMYFANCLVKDPSTPDNLAVHARSSTLEMLGTASVAGLCDIHDAVLLNDGMLLFPQRANKGGIQMGRVETSSPGLARTAWPTRLCDNQRTGWIAAW